jgi:hypothetical protein
MDAHGSYVALSRHRDGMDLHYGRDDFASQDKLVRILSRDRSKDMASDYEQLNPVRDYAERCGIAPRVNEQVAEIALKPEPDKRRILFDSRGLPGHAHGNGHGAADRESAGKPQRQAATLPKTQRLNCARPARKR